jgi:hypothetical protein
MFDPELEDEMFNADLAWTAERYGLSTDEAARRVKAIRVVLPAHEIKLFDEAGTETGTVHRAYRGFVDQLRRKEGKPHKMTHRFETPTFLRTPDPELSLLKIDAITATVTMKKRQHVERACHIPNIALNVLRNLSDGTVWLVGNKVPLAASPGVAAYGQQASREITLFPNGDQEPPPIAVPSGTTVTIKMPKPVLERDVG